MLKLLILLLLCLPSWGAYGYKRALTIDYTKVGSATHADFPVLFSGTYSWLATTANGGRVQSASGYDIAFFSDEALTTQLKHEVVSWSATTGAVEMWVKVPSISHTANTVIYVAYGDAGISTAQADPANVWTSSFSWVSHMGDGTTVSVEDSTANNNDITLANSPPASTGKIGGSVRTASSGAKYFTYNAAAGDFSGNFTLSMWVSMVNSSSGNGDWLFGQQYGSTDMNALLISASTQRISSYIKKNNADSSIAASTGALSSTGTWYHVVLTMDSGSATVIYVNGASAGSGTHTADRRMSEALSGTNIRAALPPSWWNHNDADYDEARFATAVRSSSWVLAEYNNQNSPSTFYGVGDEVGSSGARRRVVVVN